MEQACISHISYLVDSLTNPIKLPQLYENYQNSSADALSVTFLIVWFLGDVTNLAGAIWDGLLGTVIAIAIYFCFIDTALISQTFYYKLRDSRRRAASLREGVDPNDPSRPLLSDSPTANGNADARRRSSAPSRRRSSTAGSLPYVRDVSSDASTAMRWVRNLLAILAVCVAGTAAWAIAWKAGWWTPTPRDVDGDKEIILGAEILGYSSAVLYLG
jgi:solute carrier family 66 (lysosomal lysine-arginine transporter), member 1